MNQKQLNSIAMSACASLALHQSPAAAQAFPTTVNNIRPDGQHDFDFEIGTWNLHLKRLVDPLTGSNKWVEYDGTSKTRSFWNGRGNIAETVIDGSEGKIEGVTLRLYDPVGKQWNLFWANARDGKLAIPTVGSFSEGRGEFYDFERINDRFVWVRYEWSQITPRSAHFEQAFSEDGGRNWEVNWISDQVRVE